MESEARPRSTVTPLTAARTRAEMGLRLFFVLWEVEVKIDDSALLPEGTVSRGDYSGNVSVNKAEPGIDSWNL